VTSVIEIWRLPIPSDAAASRLARSRWLWPRLRIRLGDFFGCAPENLRIARAEGGKPEVTRPKGWHLSLSHGAEFSLLAISRVGPLGIDHEKRRAINDVAKLTHDFFGDDAKDLLTKLRTTEREKAFLAAWVSLEALLKATGEGFARSGGRFDEGLFRTGASGEIERDGETWRIAALPLKRGYIGAIAHPAHLGHCELRLREVRPERTEELQACS
jgi:4'-phosphopantetheinyl transferase